MTPLEYQRFHDQTLMVEALVLDHPEFDPATDPAFSEAEGAVFRKYFMPDWTKHGDDYRRALRELVAAEPDIVPRAEAVLRKFCLLHHVRTDLI
ncbi:MAG: hypothetical protein ACO1SV_08015 [Fimbriimonas sp.]